jgi:O-antigen chain-terminating methyltransferase
MSGDERSAAEDQLPGRGTERSRSRELFKPRDLLTPWGIKRTLDRLRLYLESAAARFDQIDAAIRTLQDELAETRDARVAVVERRVDAAENGLREASEEAGRLRDEVVPAAVSRSDALLERLAVELEEVASLVERSLRREPLPTADSSAIDEGRLAEALDEVQPLLLKSFRGSEDEIRHRLDRYLPELQTSPPVLDLGCGRGELLVLLREAGVEATGVEGDQALAGAARRRGLEVITGDLFEVLREQEAETFGTVTAIHVLEHLQPQALPSVLAEVRRVLRPGGLFLAECPNPHTLRVGAALYWQDPTHRRPLLPETLELFLQAAGFGLERRELLHPFPPDQLFMDDEGGTEALTDPEVTELADRLDRLRRRLDEIVNGPRDFAVWASKPSQNENSPI